jgi:hypothetical protein
LPPPNWLRRNQCSFEAEFWTEFRTVKVPLEVKIGLDGEKLTVEEYSHQIQEKGAD